MTCNVCAQSEATIHLTEIVNNQVIEVHLCEGCAEQKGTDFKSHFDFNKLLASLGEMGAPGKPESMSKMVCDVCRMPYEDFGRTGRLGCAACYRSFEQMLIPLVKRIQREVTHVGKTPGKVTGDVKHQMELHSLQEKLQKCVRQEMFEEAAKVRDKIQTIERKINRTKRQKRT